MYNGRAGHGGAGNSRTPAEALDALASDKSWEVREALARNSSLDGKILADLAGHWSWMVRAVVAENPHTPVQTLRRLAEDADQSVQKVARGRME